MKQPRPRAMHPIQNSWLKYDDVIVSSSPGCRFDIYGDCCPHYEGICY